MRLLGYQAIKISSYWAIRLLGYPLVLAYDGKHYEHLIPRSEADIISTTNLVERYTSGQYNITWLNSFTPTYAQVVGLCNTVTQKTDNAMLSANLGYQGVTTPAKKQSKTENSCKSQHIEQTPPKVNGRKKYTTNKANNEHTVVKNPVNTGNRIRLDEVKILCI